MIDPFDYYIPLGQPDKAIQCQYLILAEKLEELVNRVNSSNGVHYHRWNGLQPGRHNKRQGGTACI